MGAAMVELVDTRDLKSLGQKWLCGFESRSRHKAFYRNIRKFTILGGWNLMIPTAFLLSLCLYKHFKNRDMKNLRLLFLSASAILFLLLVGVAGGSVYMLHYSLSPDAGRHDMGRAYASLYSRVPDMKPWVDSLRRRELLRDTFVTMSSGYRAHALYLRSDSARGKTAMIVHGYKDTALKFLYLGRMYRFALQHPAARSLCPWTE